MIGTVRQDTEDWHNDLTSIPDSKILMKWPEMTSRWLLEGFKMGQLWPRKGTRRAEDGRQDDQLVQESFRWFQGGPGGPQDGPRGPQGDPQEPPGGPRVAPRWPKRAPRWHKEGPRRPQDSPKRAQDEAKMAQHGASDSKLKPKGRNIKNPQTTTIFLRFFKVFDNAPFWLQLRI